MQGSGNKLPVFNHATQIYKVASLLDPNYCLDCTYDSQTQGKLVLYSQNDGNNQKWRIMTDPNGHVGFMSLMNNGVLKVPPQPKEGDQCIVSSPTGAPTEKWQVVPAGKGYNIRSVQFPDLCLDICEERTENNTKIILWEKGSNKLNQQWVFFPL